MQDLKTGHLCHASPRAQFYGQLIGSSVSIIVTTTAYTLYNRAYVIPGPSFPAPTAYVWLSLARLLRKFVVPSRVLQRNSLIISMSHRRRPITGEQCQIYGCLLCHLRSLFCDKILLLKEKSLVRTMDSVRGCICDWILEHTFVFNCPSHRRGHGICLSNPVCEGWR